MPIPEMKRCVIATRESRLALWQAEHVRSRLSALHPGLEVVLLGMTTRGDQVLDRPLAQVGGKGLFIKELETALESGAADLAVHSMKDVPAELPPGFALEVIDARADARDALVSNRYRSLAELPHGAVVGTSSARRASQIKARFPHLELRSLRGNVETRLRKLDAGDYAVIVLAAAGLRRLGLEARITSLIDPVESLPAVGQGALAAEFRVDRPDVAELVAGLVDAPTRSCVLAERAFSHRLAGSCEVPLAGHATVDGDRLLLRGLVAMPDGSRVVRGEVTGHPADAVSLGESLAERLIAQGARSILDSLG